LIDDGILIHAPPKAKELGDLGYQGVSKESPWL